MALAGDPTSVQLEATIKLAEYTHALSAGWREFNAVASDAMTDAKFDNEYSMQAAPLVGDIRTLLLDATTMHENATTKIREWCEETDVLLEAYLECLQSTDPGAVGDQEQLVTMLEEGESILVGVLDDLKKCVSKLNVASGKFTTLRTYLKRDFDVSSAYFRSQLDTIRLRWYPKSILIGAAGGVAGLAVGEVATVVTTLLGPIGLVICVAAAAGMLMTASITVVEGWLRPQLVAHLNAIDTKFATLSSTIGKVVTSMNVAQAVVKKDSDMVSGMQTRRKTVVGFRKLKTLSPATKIRAIENLKKACNAFTKTCA